MLPVYNEDGDPSKVRSSSKRASILTRFQSWVRYVLSDTATRNLFLFLIVNLAFAFVELIYGLYSNSLGLISDSFHMFFDCTALLAGLIAQLIAKQPKNERYSYGYHRAEVLGGFANAAFLVFISFFIFKEALERFFEPPHVHTHRLLLVSVGGLVVNLIGIFVFQHGGAGHGHSHGGGGHGHSHGSHSSHSSHSSHGHSHESHGHSHNSHGHGHGGGHGHAHGGHDDHEDHDECSSSSSSSSGERNFVMDGVLLHVLADTLGSVGVIISSLLMHQYGWMVADPVCSIFISVMVFISTLPLLKNSLRILMQRTPLSLDTKLPLCYQRINNMTGVQSYREPHFWMLSSAYTIGTIIIVVSQDADDANIRRATIATFRDAGVTEMVVQVEKAVS